MKILYLGCYDQPFGQSLRSIDYSEELALLGNDIFYLSNSFDHYNLNNFNVACNKLWEEDPKTKKLLANYIRLKTPSYKTAIGRLINMIINSIDVLIFGMFNYLRGRKFDAIIGPSVPTFTSFSGVLLSRLYKCPFFYEIRDIWL